MRQYYLGQLVHRDYAKLRAAIRDRQSSSQNDQIQGMKFHTHSSLSTPLLLSSPSSLSSSLYSSSSLSSPFNPLQKQTFLTSTLQNIRLKSLERYANSNPNNPKVQFEFLQELNQSYPEAVIDRIENYSQFCIDDSIALLYFNALNRVNEGSNGNSGTNGSNGMGSGSGGLKAFNFNSFMKRLNHSNGNVYIDPIKMGILTDMHENGVEGGKKLTKPAMATRVMQILSGGGHGHGHAVNPNALLGAAGNVGMGSVGGGVGAASAMGGMGMMGTDPKYPLHVQMHNPTSGRMALFTLARQVLIAFVVVSAVTAVMDEKGFGGRAMGMGSKHVQEAEGSDVRFEDVKGVDEAKAELEEIVEYLKNPDRFTRLGGKLPTGLLLTGPPGTGKTLLAKAIAGEADVPFFFCSGSQFEEVYVGLGAKRIRELFESAKKKSPAIIFIDEIDAVGGSRKLKDQSALKMTLNELLVQMDGFDENNGVIVIGATNFAETLDTALLRPGRFDKHVSVPLPDVGGRKEILAMYAKKTQLAKDVDLGVIARGTIGFSGADLFNLMNQAALKASTDGLNSITMSVLEYAKDKIMMGAERTTAVITPKTAKITAFHEAGHALVAVLTDGAQPIHKATIMPRGQALGMVMMLPEGDQTSQSFKEMVAFMDVAMGGRVAEELIFGVENITSGAMSDIANATKTARAMVTKYGYSDEVGIVYHGGNTGEESASGATRAKIDSEVKKMTEDSYKRARDLLKKCTKEHHLLAETLLEYETLTGDEVRDIILKGKKPNRPITNKDGGARGDRSVLNAKSSSSSSSRSKFPGLSGKVAGSRRDATEA